MSEVLCYSFCGALFMEHFLNGFFVRKLTCGLLSALNIKAGIFKAYFRFEVKSFECSFETADSLRPR
jgi:hypothetical protein